MAAKATASPMTKTQLVGHIAEKFELPRRVAGEILQELSDLAVNETKKKGQFVIPGIGKLVKAQRKARMGVNPKTKERIKIPAKTVVKFRVMKAAKEAIAPPKK
ncbi:MAG: HU family DNA-binding protein [Acidobacteriota bacterium]